MSLLIEKRDEMLAKLEALRAERDKAIEEKLNIYKFQLESEYPFTKEYFDAEKVVKALDELIAYEEANKIKEEVKAEPVIEAEPIVEPEPIVEEVKEETIEAEKEEAKAELPFENITLSQEPAVEIVTYVEETPSNIEIDEKGESITVKTAEESRPGMAYVGIPERR